MGYCPFEHWLGWAQGRWAHKGGRQAGARRWGTQGTQAGGRRARGRVGRAGVAGARGARSAGRLGRPGRARPGVLLGQLAVHSVHAACL